MAYPNVSEDRFTLLVSNAMEAKTQWAFLFFIFGTFSSDSFHPSVFLVGTSSVELFSPGLLHSSYLDINVTQAHLFGDDF